jgi:hypothetical protein
MNSTEIKTIFKYFMEPHQLHEEVWIMRPKYKNFELIVCCSYNKCFELAQKQIEENFKFVKP